MTPTPAGLPGDLLAVVSQTGPTVTFFDAATHERLEVLQVPPQPHELCFDPDHRLLYCTSTYRSGFYDANEGPAHEITVIDVDTRTVVTTLGTAPDHAPHGLALDRERGRLYVSVEATGTEPGGVLIIDTRTHARLGRIPTMAPGPHWFALTPDGRQGFATNKEARSSPSSTSTAGSARPASPSPAAKASPSPPTAVMPTWRPPRPTSTPRPRRRRASASSTPPPTRSSAPSPPGDRSCRSMSPRPARSSSVNCARTPHRTALSAPTCQES